MNELGLKKGTVLGKCFWCTQPIKEGEVMFASYWAKIINMKWYCAECLVGLKSTVDELALQKEYREDVDKAEAENNLDSLKQKWIVENGKIRLNSNYDGEGFK